MTMNLDTEVAPARRVGPIHLLLRLMIVMYLSPAILAFLAISLVGVLVANLGIVSVRGGPSGDEAMGHIRLSHEHDAALSGLRRACEPTV